MDDAVSLTAGAKSDYPSSQNSHIPHDDATVAVMERLTLHDILVRIPTNHGDLGHNSHIGHIDNLCTRKMNSVPLSDFFAASSVVRERRHGNHVGGGAKPTIWMGGDAFRNINTVFLQTKEDDDEMQCAIDSEPHPRSAENEIREPKASVNMKGMSPTDPQFLTMATGFVLCIAIASRIW
jgi:hypothetical protein